MNFYLDVMFELFTCTYIIPKYNTALKDGKETHTFWSNHLVLQFVFSSRFVCCIPVNISMSKSNKTLSLPIPTILYRFKAKQTVYVLYLINYITTKYFFMVLKYVTFLFTVISSASS